MAKAVLVGVFLVSFLAGAWGTSSVMPPSLQATHCDPSAQQQTKGSSQQSVPAAYGIDGYLQHATGSLADPACNKIVMGLFVNTADRQSFIQVGTRIGYRPGGGTDNSTTVFTERKDATGCFSYYHVGWGSPTATNAAYYVYYTGTYGQACGQTYYLFGVKRDAWENSDFATYYFPVASPRWTAQQEIGSLEASPPWAWLGTTYHGWPDSQLSHGMAWFNQPNQTWNEWSSAVSTTTGALAPLIYCDDAGSSYRAFHTKKSGSCP